MATKIDPKDLVLHFLNVGFGDCCVIEFPEYRPGKRSIGVVDCNTPTGKPDKALVFLRALRLVRDFDRVEFVCATHPHFDHVSGIQALLESDLPRPDEFWDSGFRYTSATYLKILNAIVVLNANSALPPIQVKRISAGMESYYGSVRVTALAPAIALRNRFATYGVNSNDASIVLRLEHCAEDPVTVQSRRYSKDAPADPWLPAAKGRAVAILGGDAEFESWACVDADFPQVQKELSTQPLVTEAVNPLECDLVKVSHHGSKDSAPLAIYSRSNPTFAVISVSRIEGAEKFNGGKFPHQLTTIALGEEKARIYTTDGSNDDRVVPAGNAGKPGSVVAVLRHGKNTVVNKLDDQATDPARVVTELES